MHTSTLLLFISTLTISLILLVVIIKQQKKIDLLLTLIKTPTADQHYYHLSQQLFQSVESLTKAMQNSSHQSQALVHDSFQKFHKEAQEQVSKGQLHAHGLFNELTQRFSSIEAWQVEIQQLTYKVHQLAKVLDHSTLKGKFGEMHLENIIKSLYPASWIEFQSTLSNGTRVDCLLSMGKNKLKIAIDSKFPLQTFKMLINHPEEPQYVKDFIQVIKKNILNIAEKYIIQGVTTDYALMFVPSDALFSKIIELDDITHFAQQQRVLLCSPQTLFWLLSVMKKFLIDFELNQNNTKKLATIALVGQHTATLLQEYQQIEKKAVALAKEIRSLKHILLELTDLIHMITELPVEEKEEVEATQEP